MGFVKKKKKKKKTTTTKHLSVLNALITLMTRYHLSFKLDKANMSRVKERNEKATGHIGTKEYDQECIQTGKEYSLFNTAYSPLA